MSCQKKNGGEERLNTLRPVAELYSGAREAMPTKPRLILTHTAFMTKGAQPACSSSLYSSKGTYGTGLSPHTLDFTMVDNLQLPELEAGEYSLSWRWDCEETPQVWNACSDVSITDSASPSPL